MEPVGSHVDAVKDISVQEGTNGTENLVSSRNFVVSITLFVLGVLSVLAGFVLVCLCIFSVLNPTMLIVSGSFLLMLLGLILVAISISVGSKKLLKLKREVGESQEEVSSVKREVKDTRDKLDRVEEECKQKVQSLNNELQALRNELQDKETTVQELVNRERVAKDALRKKEDDFAESHKKIMLDNRKLKEENDQLNADIGGWKERVRGCEAKIEELNRTQLKNQRDLHEVQKQLSEAQQERDELEDQFQLEIESLTRKNQKLRKDNSALDSALEDQRRLVRQARGNLELDLEEQRGRGETEKLEHLRTRLEMLQSRVQLDRAGVSHGQLDQVGLSDGEDEFDSQRKRSQSR